MKTKTVSRPSLRRCSARFYKGDRAHYWDIEMGHYVYRPERLPRKVIAEDCPDHRKPVKYTVEQLVEFLTSEFKDWRVTSEVVTWSKNYKYVNVKAESPDGVTVEMYYPEKREPVRTSFDHLASGHTSFTTALGTRSFDRTGVENSFYVRHSNTFAEIAATIREQLEKVATSRARIARSEAIPGLPFTITPESKAEVAAKLAAGKHHTFLPSGFGTGYDLYKGLPRRYDHRATPETETFFGVTPLSYATVDHD